MQDMQAHLEKLRTDAADCALIRDLATDPAKRELFTRLADHLAMLAGEIEAAIAARLRRRRQDGLRLASHRHNSTFVRNGTRSSRVLF